MPAKKCPACNRWYTDAQDCGCPRQPDLTDRLQARKLPCQLPPADESWREGLKSVGGLDILQADSKDANGA